MIKEFTNNDLMNLNKLASYFNISITSEDLVNQNNYYIGYELNQDFIAFASYSIYYERAELNYIFVLEQFRRKKIASNLLEYILNKVKHLDNITLEVREGNIAAIKLYEKYGFKKCAIRNRYYGNENAILMIKEFGEKNGR